MSTNHTKTTKNVLGTVLGADSTDYVHEALLEEIDRLNHYSKKSNNRSANRINELRGQVSALLAENIKLKTENIRIIKNFNEVDLRDDFMRIQAHYMNQPHIGI